MNWQQKVEAQIAFLDRRYRHAPPGDKRKDTAPMLRALLDVAVAADQLFNELAHYGHESADSMNAMSDALDKLREVSDE